jgi:hypothetical protein
VRASLAYARNYQLILAGMDEGAALCNPWLTDFAITSNSGQTTQTRLGAKERNPNRNSDIAGPCMRNAALQATEQASSLIP